MGETREKEEQKLRWLQLEAEAEERRPKNEEAREARRLDVEEKVRLLEQEKALRLLEAEQKTKFLETEKEAKIHEREEAKKNRMSELEKMQIKVNSPGLRRGGVKEDTVESQIVRSLKLIPKVREKSSRI